MDLKNILSGIKGKKIKKDQLLIVFLTGILLMIIAIPTKNHEDTEVGENNYEMLQGNGRDENIDYTRYLEEKLEVTISQMEGVGDVTCMITLLQSAEQIIEKDLEITDENVAEKDSQGGTRTTSQSSHSETTIYNGEENGEPYVSKELFPKVEGVVVLSDGGDNAMVVKNITEAIHALFGIESHKIRIVKKGES